MPSSGKEQLAAEVEDRWVEFQTCAFRQAPISAPGVQGLCRDGEALRRGDQVRSTDSQKSRQRRQRARRFPSGGGNAFRGMFSGMPRGWSASCSADTTRTSRGDEPPGL